jgi:hypothetical protein
MICGMLLLRVLIAIIVGAAGYGSDHQQAKRPYKGE